MTFTLADAQQLKQSLGQFNSNVAVDLNESASALGRYLSFYGFNTLPCSAYHLGFISLEGELARWGKLACHWWRAPLYEKTKTPRGTIFFAPGLFDHGGLFKDLIMYWLNQGFDLICVEMPGHGLSDGDNCAVDSFLTYGKIWRFVIQQLEQNLAKPLIGVGQSTGCAALTALTLSAGQDLKIAKLIFFAPLVRPQKWRYITMLYWMLSKFIAKTPRNLRINSHATIFNELLWGDVLQPKYLSVRWTAALRNWVAILPSLPSTQTPLLILQGTGDKVVDWPFNIPSLQAHFPHNRVQYFPAAMHHLANEPDPWRSDIFIALTNFVADIQGSP